MPPSSASAYRCPACGTAHTRRIFSKRGRDYHECAACATVFVWPPPNVDEQWLLYREAYADREHLYARYDAFEPVKRRNFASRLELLEQWSRHKGRLLDVGCATGILLEVARDHGWDVFGIDLSESAIAHAGRRVGDDRVLCGALDDAAFSDAQFDVVTMLDCIEHVADPAGTLRTVARILRDGGIALITTPDTQKLSRHLLGRYWPHFQWEHLVLFSRRSLTRFIHRCSLSVLDMRNDKKFVNCYYLLSQLCEHSPKPAASMCRVLLRVLPQPLLNYGFRLSVGQQLVIAQKRSPDASRTGARCPNM